MQTLTLKESLLFFHVVFFSNPEFIDAFAIRWDISSFRCTFFVYVEPR